MLARYLSVTILTKLNKHPGQIQTLTSNLAEHVGKILNFNNTARFVGYLSPLNNDQFIVCFVETVWPSPNLKKFSCHLTPNRSSNIWVYYWPVLKSSFTLESHNLELDIDIAGDLALLKKNLAKFKKGKHRKGLQDILIQELDWVSTCTFILSIQILILTYHTYNIRWRTIGRWRLLPSWFMKHLFK